MAAARRSLKRKRCTWRALPGCAARATVRSSLPGSRLQACVAVVHSACGTGLVLCASVFVLASCDAASDMMNSPVSRGSEQCRSRGAPIRTYRANAFHPAKRSRVALVTRGTLQYLVRREGLSPELFTARGKVSGVLIFHERFEIRSGSISISGSADSQASGTPTSGCSKSGKLSFDFPISQYRMHHPRASGMGNHAALSGS